MIKYKDKNVNEIEFKEIEKMGWEIGNLFRESRVMKTDNLIAICYAALIAKSEQCKTLKEIIAKAEEYVAKDESYFVKESIGEKLELVFAVAEKYSEEELINFILFASTCMDYGHMNEETPDSLSELVIKLLDIKSEDHVADFGCARGTFIIKSFLNNYATYFGNEINTSSKAIAKIRASLLDGQIEIKQEDMFKMSEGTKFDKIFSNYPFGMRIKDLNEGFEYLNQLSSVIPNIAKATSSDWIFNSLLLKSLKENGKAIGIMTNGSTWNSIDKPIREYFVRNGLIECVISLPARLFEITAIPTTLIVLSSGNKKIKMVDAHEIYHEGRRQNTFTGEDIDKIISYVHEESDLSRDVSLDEIVENDFVINPIRYLTEELNISEALEFGEVIKTITRGAQCKASELDEIISSEPTSMQYLMLSNIQDGMIDSELPYLREIEEKYKKYCIKNNSLLLSKNGIPFKIAVADVAVGKEILGNGNLYIIELDEEKVNPYFIKAFLESERGIASLKKITVGATIPNIAVEALKKMKVPVPSMDIQKNIAHKYLAKLDEIKILNLRLVKAKNALKNIYEEVE